MKPKVFRTVYLLHFDAPVGRSLHYMGMTSLPTVDDRMRRHACGDGARILRRLFEAGHGFHVVRTWTPAQPDTEGRLKQAGHFRDLCPMCRWPLLTPVSTYPHYSPKHPSSDRKGVVGSWKGLTWGPASLVHEKRRSP